MGTVSPAARAATPPERDRRAPGEPPPHGDLVLHLLLRDRLDRCDPHPRRAGPMAETIVTPTPTIRQTMTVRASKTRGPEGSVTPKPLEESLQSERGQDAQPQANERRHEAHDPCFGEHRDEDLRRLAPTMRSSASSFVR